jgi:IS30 family transposase
VKLTTKTQGDFMTKRYHHLTYDQRCQIYILKERGDSCSSIARAIYVDPSTVRRELQRNRGQRGYRHQQAHLKALGRRNPKPNKKITKEMAAIINEKLDDQWSPVQISGWLKKHNNEYVSFKTIYSHIFKNRKNGGRLHKELRHKGKKYHKYHDKSSGRGCIPGRIDIKMRPPIVEEKSRLGDWELDTIIGAGHNGAIVSMVERTSKLTKLAKVNYKTAAEVSRAIIDTLSPIKEFVHTVTADNGKEFAYHQLVSMKLETGFYFATPYRSWERGLNEHTNGLIRQYFPKSQSLSDVSAADILKVETLLNNRPRKILNFETPLEAFARLSSDVLSSRSR